MFLKIWKLFLGKVNSRLRDRKVIIWKIIPQLWTQFIQLRKKPAKTNQSFNGIWTRDLAIHFLFKGIEYFIEYWGLDILLKSWFFFSGFFRNCINCVHKCENHSSFDFISAVLVYDLFHLRLSDRWMAQHAGFKVVKAPCFCKSGPLIPSVCYIPKACRNGGKLLQV